MSRFLKPIVFSFLTALLLCSRAFAAPVQAVLTKYGAKADSKTDCTAAFKRALASGSKNIYIPAGTYLLGPECLNVPENASISGDGFGTVLKLAKDTGTVFALAPGCRLSSLAIDGKLGKSGGVTEGVVSVGSAAFCVIDSMSFRDCDRACILTDHATDLTIRNCDFRNVGLAASLQFSSRVKVLNNTLVDAKVHGFQFWGNWKFENKASEDLIFTGNYVKNGGGGGIWGTGATRVIAANNIVDGANDVGIDLEWCDDSVISGNTIRNCENAGISLFYSCSRVSITGNTVINDREIKDPEAEWYVRSGIWLTYPNTETFKNDTGHKDISIVGNTVYSLPGRRRAMWIGSGSSNVTISANTVSGASSWQGGEHKVTPMVLKEIPDNIVIGKQ